VPVNLNEVRLELPINPVSIHIVDARKEVSEEEDLKIPFISGLKKKSWKHHPKLKPEYSDIIQSAIRQNFMPLAKDTGDITIKINYACKEFEQTGMSEIERVYLNTEAHLRTANFEGVSTVVDTFHFQSADASNKHIEQFFLTSLQNNIVRNVSQLRHQFYNTELKKEECFDDTFSKGTDIDGGVQLLVSGKYNYESLKADRITFNLTQDWKFKISSNQDGKLKYIESMNMKGSNPDELQKVISFLNKIQFVELDNNRSHYCRVVSIQNAPKE